jgi:hypothetical protein
MLPDSWPLKLYWKLLTYFLVGRISIARAQQLKDEWHTMVIVYDDIVKGLNRAIPGLGTMSTMSRFGRFGTSGADFAKRQNGEKYTAVIKGFVRGVENSAVSTSVEINKQYVHMQLLVDSVNWLYSSTRRDVGMP